MKVYSTLVATAVITAAMMLAAACGGGAADSEPTATASPATTPQTTPSATATSAATAAPTPEQAPEATRAPSPATGGGEVSYRITNTEGDGVALRSDCTDASRIAEAVGQGFRDGDEVVLLRDDNAACAGWALVADGEGRASWVRLRYLASEPASSWAVDIESATWASVMAEADDSERECIESNLTQAERAAASEYGLIASEQPAPWAPALGACLAREKVVELTLAFLLPGLSEIGADPEAAGACIRPFVAELAAHDPGELFADASAAPPSEIMIDGFTICFADAFIDAFVAGSGLTGAASATASACIREERRAFVESMLAVDQEALQSIVLACAGGSQP